MASPAVSFEALEAEIEQAVLAFRSGRPAQSVRRLRAVRRRAERWVALDPSRARAIQARTLMSESAPTFEIAGDLDEALALLAQAEETALAVAAREASGDPPALVPMVRGQRALMLLRAGRTAEALAAFDEAVATLDQAPLVDRAIILLNRGALHLELADIDAARADLEASAEHAAAAKDRMQQAMASHNLGYVAFLDGRLPRALADLEVAAGAYPLGPHPTMLLDRARVLREAGLVTEADELLEQAAAVTAEHRLVQDLAEIELVRAECALVRGDAARARGFAASARRRFGRRGNVRWLRRAQLLELRCERLAADDRSPRARRTALLATAERATALAEACRAEGRRDLARNAGLLAEECRMLAGDPPADRLPTVRATDPLTTRMQTREVRALAARCRGDLPAAAREVRRGLTELGGYQHSFGSLDLRTASAVHGAGLSRIGLDVALASGSPARVLHLVEQYRAVSTRLPPVGPPGDERTARLLTELRRAEEEARGLEGDAEGEDRLAALRAEASRLQGEIRSRAWELEAEHGSVDEAPRCVRVREAAAASGSAFATYARHDGRWVAVSVRGSKVELHDLAPVGDVSGLVTRVRADLDALALPHLPPPMLAAVRGSLDAGLARLDTLLVAPLRAQGRPLVVSCGGDLVMLPWGLLPSRVGTSTVVTPSASFWLAGLDTPGRPADPRVVAVAGPDLRLAADEAVEVAGTWKGGRALTGAEATTAEAHAALLGADLVHVAAHGRHRPDNPLFSSVRMADGDLYAYEVDPTAAGGRTAGCVVLSACEAGLATVRPGDESLGLTHVLLQLGTRSVVAGVARVRDDVSARLMRRAHHAMTLGADAAAAVADAQHQSLEEGAPAAFVCFGATW